MNIISKLKNKQKALVIAGSLLLGAGLALTSTASIAANAEYERYRNHDTHHTNKQHDHRNAEKEMEYQDNGRRNKHGYAERRHHAAKWHHGHHNKHRNHYHGKHYHGKHYHGKHYHGKHYHGKHYHGRHYHGKPHYMLSNDHYYHHPDRFDLQIGVHTDNLDIIMRD